MAALDEAEDGGVAEGGEVDDLFADEDASGGSGCELCGEGD